jgi:hypothetical protein
MVTGDDIGRMKEQARVMVAQDPRSLTAYAIWCALTELHGFWTDEGIPPMDAARVGELVGQPLTDVQRMLDQGALHETDALNELLAGLYRMR